MKVAVWAAVYYAVCFLMFTGWIIGFSQHPPFHVQEQPFSLTYLYNLFYLYVVMEPYYQFFQIDRYFSSLMVLADDTGQMISFYKDVPVMWIYSLSTLLTFVIYIISANWFKKSRGVILGG